MCARRSSAGGGPFAARLGYLRHHGDLVEDAPFVNDFAFALSKILAANPDAIHNTNDSAWGPLGKFHHWGEPHFGYYLSDDARVIRKPSTSRGFTRICGSTGRASR